MGAAQLAIPWAFQQSGIVLGTFMTVACAPIAFYTTKLVVQAAGDKGDYFDLLYKYFGKWHFRS